MTHLKSQARFDVIELRLREQLLQALLRDFLAAELISEVVTIAGTSLQVDVADLYLRTLRIQEDRITVEIEGQAQMKQKRVYFKGGFSSTAQVMLKKDLQQFRREITAFDLAFVDPSLEVTSWRVPSFVMRYLEHQVEKRLRDMGDRLLQEGVEKLPYRRFFELPGYIDRWFTGLHVSGKMQALQLREQELCVNAGCIAIETNDDSQIEVELGRDQGRSIFEITISQPTLQSICESQLTTINQRLDLENLSVVGIDVTLHQAKVIIELQLEGKINLSFVLSATPRFEAANMRLHLDALTLQPGPENSFLAKTLIQSTKRILLRKIDRNLPLDIGNLISDKLSLTQETGKLKVWISLIDAMLAELELGEGSLVLRGSGQIQGQFSLV